MRTKIKLRISQNIRKPSENVIFRNCFYKIVLQNHSFVHYNRSRGVLHNLFRRTSLLSLMFAGLPNPLIVLAILELISFRTNRWTYSNKQRIFVIYNHGLDESCEEKVKILIVNGIEVQNWDKLKSIFANSMYGEAN